MIYNVAIDLHGTYGLETSKFNELISSYRNIEKSYYEEQVRFFIFSGSPISDMLDQIARLPGNRDMNMRINDVVIFEHMDAKFTTVEFQTPEDGTQDYSITFTLLSVVDFCKDQGLPMEQRLSPRTDKPTWYFAGPESVWWAMKAIMCDVYDISLLVDDKIQYSSYFGNLHQTKFHYWSPSSINNDLNFEFVKRYIDRRITGGPEFGTAKSSIEAWENLRAKRIKERNS